MMIMNFFGLMFALKFHFEKEKLHTSFILIIFDIKIKITKEYMELEEEKRENKPSSV